MRCTYTERPEWPPLGWLAELRPGAHTVRVRHGRKVETRPEWFCEAVWAGELADGDFDRTDIVFGSGARIRGDRLTFVSSGSLCDRLQWMRKGDRLWVSNSLACLMAASGAELDPVGSHYVAFFVTSIEGLNGYQRSLATSAGDVNVTYFHNLEWTGADLVRIDKSHGERGFADFADYRDFLGDCLVRVAANMSAPERKTRYRFVGTLSQGYDSPAAATLAASAGLERVLCFERGGPDAERGSELAPHLGLEPIVFPLEAWRGLDRPEIPFIAGDGFGEEVHLAAAEDHLADRVLVTGHYGGKPWDKHTTDPNPHIVRKDTAGLALTEYRLRAGFIHLPVPFLGVRAAADIHRISNSKELAPWDVGGEYTRPICRRIVEEAGAPRHLFGQKKRFAARWLLTSKRFLTDGSRADYCEWLRAHRPAWWRRGRPPPIRSERFDRLELAVLHTAGGCLIAMPGFYRLGLHRVQFLRRLALARAADSKIAPVTTGFRRFVVPWAMERTKRAYQGSGADAALAEGGARSSAASRAGEGPAVSGHPT